MSKLRKTDWSDRERERVPGRGLWDHWGCRTCWWMIGRVNSVDNLPERTDVVENLEESVEVTGGPVVAKTSETSFSLGVVIVTHHDCICLFDSASSSNENPTERIEPARFELELTQRSKIRPAAIDTVFREVVIV